MNVSNIRPRLSLSLSPKKNGMVSWNCQGCASVVLAEQALPQSSLRQTLDKVPDCIAPLGKDSQSSQSKPLSQATPVHSK